MKKITFVLIVVLVFISTSCCNCNNEKNLIKGYITVIGNEPFTKLAINDGKKLFGLKCNKELYEKLMKEQGNYYVLEFDDAINEDGISFLNVINAMKINQSK